MILHYFDKYIAFFYVILECILSFGISVFVLYTYKSFSYPCLCDLLKMLHFSCEWFL